MSNTVSVYFMTVDETVLPTCYMVNGIWPSPKFR